MASEGEGNGSGMKNRPHCHHRRQPSMIGGAGANAGMPWSDARLRSLYNKRDILFKAACNTRDEMKHEHIMRGRSGATLYSHEQRQLQTYASDISAIDNQISLLETCKLGDMNVKDFKREEAVKSMFMMKTAASCNEMKHFVRKSNMSDREMIKVNEDVEMVVDMISDKNDSIDEFIGGFTDMNKVRHNNASAGLFDPNNGLMDDTYKKQLIEILECDDEDDRVDQEVSTASTTSTVKSKRAADKCISAVSPATYGDASMTSYQRPQPTPKSPSTKQHHRFGSDTLSLLSRLPSPVTHALPDHGHQ